MLSANNLKTLIYNMGKKRLVVLTGAGISAESGIKTFRDEDGLWEGHDVMQVASPEGFRRNPELVHEFYNLRRKQLLTVEPNAAHHYLAELEKDFHVQIVTQNVDDLHERAGSSQVLHLHGELLKIQSLQDPQIVIPWTKNLNVDYRDENNHSYRPFIVWFGEAVPLLEDAVRLCEMADICIVIGTSLQVYPAAALLDYCSSATPIFYVDPRPSSTHQFTNHHQITVLPHKAGDAVPLLREKLASFI